MLDGTRDRSASSCLTPRIGWAVRVLVGALASACGPAAPVERPANLILVTVDTLRADHLSSHGYARPTTPVLARLGEQGVRFAQALSQAPWTLPSMASVQTSLYPSQHGADGGERAVPEKAVTLAERLRAAGYHTVGVVSHQFVSGAHGFAQGFEVFDETNVHGHGAVTSKALTQTALERLEGVREPFFLWVHYFDPHFTYVEHPEVGFGRGYEGKLPPQISAKRIKQLEDEGVSDPDVAYIEALYDEELVFTDRWIGKLLDGLNARYGADRSVVAVTADHGEYFHERGRFFHGKDVYQALVHVPLVIAGAIDPDLRGTVVETPVETRSLARTLLGRIGIEDGTFAGVDLFAVARSHRAPPVFSEGSHAFGEDAKKVAVVLDGWKLIHRLDDDGYELYSLADDPEERVDRLADGSSPSADLLAKMRRELAEFARLPRLEPRTIGLSPEVLRDLDDLGYSR